MVKRNLEFLGILAALSWGRPPAESPLPQLVGKPWKNIARQIVPKRTAGLGIGARPLSLVLKRIRSLPLPGLSYQAATVYREAGVLSLPSSLVSATTDPGFIKTLSMLQGRWTQHHLWLNLPPLPLTPRNSEIVESKGYRTRIFPLPYYSRAPENEGVND